jgi:hypothetical protein
MIPDWSFAPVTVSNGDRFVLQLPDSGGGTNAITLLRERGTREVERLTWPYPTAGLGGGGLTPSPSEKLLLFSCFSGQSEEAYRVISIGSAMRELCACEYRFGEAASYAFSPDEQVLLMALPSTCSEWWLPWDDRELQEDEAGRRYLEFGLIRIQDLRDSSASQHAIRVYPPDSWEPERGDYDADLRPDIDDAGGVTLRVPWGRLVLTRPIPEVVNVELPHGPRSE